VAIQSNTETAGSEWRFRRSGHISGLDNSNRDVLRPGGGTRYSQVGAAVHGGRNTYVTYARRPLRTTEHPQMSASRCATSATPFDVRSPILAVSGIDHTGGRTAGDQFPRRPRIPSRKIRGARERRLCECTTTCRRSASRGPAQANVTHGSLVAPERPQGDRREIAGRSPGDRRAWSRPRGRRSAEEDGEPWARGCRDTGDRCDKARPAATDEGPDRPRGGSGAVARERLGNLRPLTDP
jgi:hypothetical protein